jgi:hypothetical protein
MALALAFKRTARFYTPSLRRAVARDLPFVSAWLLGLCTGMLGRRVDSDWVIAIMIGGLAVLAILRKWAGEVPPQAAAE